MANIYEINQAILDCIDPETGEVLDMEALEQLQMDRVQKAENVACWRKNLMALIRDIKEEEDALKKRREVLQRKVDGIDGYLAAHFSGEKIETARAVINWRKSTGVEVLNKQEAIDYLMHIAHEELLKYKEPDIDKKAAKALLESGEAIPGLALTDRMNLQIK
jgi:urease gamma subunit